MNKYVCPDCGAELQEVGERLRCPWATPSSRGTAWINGVAATTCKRPYTSARKDIEAPLTGRISR